MPSLWERLRIKRAREATLEGGVERLEQPTTQQGVPFYRQPRWWLKAAGITLLVLAGAGIAAGFLATVGWPALVAVAGVTASYAIVSVIGALGAAFLYAISSWAGKKVGQYYSKRASNTNNSIVTPKLKASAGSPANVKDVIAAIPIIEEVAPIAITPVQEPPKSGFKKASGKKKKATGKKSEKQQEEIQQEEQEQKEREKLEQEIVLFWDSYLAVLGLEQDATPEQIKKGYRELALKYHTDKNQSPEAAEIIRKINIIYNILEKFKFALPERLRPLYKSLAGERELLKNQDGYLKDMDEHIKHMGEYQKKQDALIIKQEQLHQVIHGALKKRDVFLAHIKAGTARHLKLADDYLENSRQLHAKAAVVIPEIQAIAKEVEASTARTQQHAKSAAQTLAQMGEQAADFDKQAADFNKHAVNLMARLNQAEARLDGFEKPEDKAGPSRATVTGTKLSWAQKKLASGKDVVAPTESPEEEDLANKMGDNRIPPPAKK